MTGTVNEQLSACLDGELPREELALLLKRLERGAPAGEELRETLGRYALISEALRNEAPAAASRDFAARVMAAVEEAPAPARPAITFPPGLARRLRPAAGMAVAASVAAVAVFSVQRTGVLPETVAVNDPAPAPAPRLIEQEASYVVPTSVSPASFVPATRLTNYVVAHSEYSSPLGRRSVLTGVLADDEAQAAASSPEDPPAAAPQER